MTGVYMSYYSVIELPGVVGPFAAVLAGTSFVTANIVKNTYEDPWKLGLAVHILCWVFQFYGKEFEGLNVQCHYTLGVLYLIVLY